MKKTHGGKRIGAGAKKKKKSEKKESTKVIRVPKALVEDFKNISRHHPKKWHYSLVGI